MTKETKSAEFTMTDQEVLTFCGFKPFDPPEATARFLAELTPAKREVMEKMRQIEMWDASDGVVPLPEGVLIDRPKDRHMRRWIDK